MLNIDLFEYLFNNNIDTFLDLQLKTCQKMENNLRSRIRWTLDN